MNRLEIDPRRHQIFMKSRRMNLYWRRFVLFSLFSSRLNVRLKIEDVWFGGLD
uniref:Uncharacterized protein n=1 Tax=Parascaris equorum TaxID=6256 RepID=A0A914S698_PAREQ